MCWTLNGWHALDTTWTWIAFLEKILIYCSPRHRLERRNTTKKNIGKIGSSSDFVESYLNLVWVRIYLRRAYFLPHLIVKNHVFLPRRWLRAKYTKQKSLSFCTCFLFLHKRFGAHQRSNKMDYFSLQLFEFKIEFKIKKFHAKNKFKNQNRNPNAITALTTNNAEIKMIRFAHAFTVAAQSLYRYAIRIVRKVMNLDAIFRLRKLSTEIEKF